MRGATLAFVVIVLAACSGGAAGPRGEPDATRIPNPYPFATPTPAAEPSDLDGTYTRAVPDEAAGPLGVCKRCPPYRLELGDTNVMTIDRGVLRVRNEGVGWESSVHAFVEADRIVLINDPNCIGTEGIYAWRLEAGRLTLDAIDDDCAFGGLRSRYLAAAPWTREEA